MKIVYYTEVTSSWCFWAEPAWAELKAHFATQAEFSWKIALMDASGLPESQAQCEWFYRRSGTLMQSPFKLNPAWFDPTLKEYVAPNFVAEAAKDFGITDDRVRLAIATAALRGGEKIAAWDVSARVAASAVPDQLDVAVLLDHAHSPEIEARVRETTREFHALGVTQRPTFVMENTWGDRAILSGLARATPLIAAADALLADEQAQLSYTVHHGGPPPP